MKKTFVQHLLEKRQSADDKILSKRRIREKILTTLPLKPVRVWTSKDFKNYCQEAYRSEKIHLGG